MKSRTVLSVFRAFFLVLFLAVATSVGASSMIYRQSALTATLAQLSGDVQARDSAGGQFAKANAGQSLSVGGQVQTGADGRASLALSSGTFIRVAPSSLFTLTSNDEVSGGLDTSFSLEAGELWIALSGGGADVETPGGVAAVQGSHMSVKVTINDDGTVSVMVTCFSGQCSYTDKNGNAHDVPPKQALDLNYNPATGEVTAADLRDMTDEEFDAWIEAIKLQEDYSDTLGTISKLDTTGSGSYASNPQFSLGSAQVTVTNPDAGVVTASLIRLNRLGILPKADFEIVSHGIRVDMTGSGSVQVCFAYPPVKSDLQVVRWNSVSDLIAGDWAGMETFSDGLITCAKVPAGVFALADL